MNDPSYPPKQKNESNPLVDYLLIGGGSLSMLFAFVLILFFMISNGRIPIANSSENSESFVYNGQQIYHVPAGSRTIEALSYSSQAPVVVMFDADW